MEELHEVAQICLKGYRKDLGIPMSPFQLGMLPSMLLLERSKVCNLFWASRKVGNSGKLQEDNLKDKNLGRVALIFAFETNTLLPERSRSLSSLSSKKVFNSTLPFRLIEERDSLCSLVKLEIDLGIDSFNLFSLNIKIDNADEETFWNLSGPVS